MPQEPITLTVQIEIEREDGNARKCGACGLPCFGESDAVYLVNPRERLFTLCDKCAGDCQEWRDTQ